MAEDNEFVGPTTGLTPYLTVKGGKDAIAFYEACGWLEAGRTESEAGTPTRIEYVKHRRKNLS